VLGQSGTTYSNTGSSNVRRLEVFRDDGTKANSGQTLDIVTFVPNSVSPFANKYLSGVNYYNSTTPGQDEFTLTMESSVVSTKLFANSYLRTALMRATPSGLGNSAVDFSLAQLTQNYNGGTQPATASVGTIVDATYGMGANAFSVFAKMTGRFSDPFGDSSNVTTTNKILTNTYGVVSTDTVELFRDESRRYSNDTTPLPDTDDFDSPAANYPATPVGAHVFDNITSLNPGNLNNAQGLQVGGLQANPNQSGLMYPQDDYSIGFEPSSPAQSDYSSLSGDRYYYRTFATTVVQNFGRLRLSLTSTAAGDHATALPLSAFQGIISNGPLEIALKIPGSTVWFDIGTPLGSTSIDGMGGCLDSGVSGHNPASGFYGFSFGPNFNGVSLAMRVRYRGSSPKTQLLARVELFT